MFCEQVKNVLLEIGEKKFQKILPKKIAEKILWKNFMCRKIFYFPRFCEIYFSENKSIENWSMAVGVWLFCPQIEGHTPRMSVNKNKNLKLKWHLKYQTCTQNCFV